LIENLYEISIPPEETYGAAPGSWALPGGVVIYQMSPVSCAVLLGWVGCLRRSVVRYLVNVVMVRWQFTRRLSGVGFSGSV
jgi:hypothetical protein